MKIAFDLNGVIRDIFLKTEQVYTKFYLEEKDDEVVSEYNEDTEKWEENSSEDIFEYGLNLPVTSMDLINHFKFETPEDLYNFFYVDFPMNIFGHSPSISGNTFNILNDLYVDHRDNNEIYIISDEIGKSKPATLFFLSKYGCLIENIKFYSKSTLGDTFSEFDVMITSNPDFLSKEDSNKKIIKINTKYNQEYDADFILDSISEVGDILKKII